MVGFVLDFVLRGVLPKSLRGGYTGHADEVDCHEEHSDEEGKPAPIWKAALRHTLEIFVFIFAFSLVFGLIVEGVGEDVFASVLGRQRAADPAVCGRCSALFQSGGGPLHRCRRGPCGAVAHQSFVEAELVHHRPDMGCRRIPRRGNAGGRGRVCVITRRSCKENSIVKQNKAIAWNSVQ